MNQHHGTRSFIGIDLGGTNTKFGIVSEDGTLIHTSVCQTPPNAGRERLLGLLGSIAESCLEMARQRGIAPSGLGVATPGWVNPATGQVVYASDNIPGWTGTNIASELQRASGLSVAVENDANAVAVAEKYYGVAQGVDNFVCVTLGTGIGSGCYINGRLHYGAHYLANELGHIQIQNEGLPCSCGKHGCLEAYANAAALVRYAGEGVFASAEQIIAAANEGDVAARNAIRSYARFLAMGCLSVVHLLDPSLLVFAGGITQNNPALLLHLERELTERMLVPKGRSLQLRYSQLGYFGGVLGAAAVARERLG